MLASILDQWGGEGGGGRGVVLLLTQHSPTHSQKRRKNLSNNAISVHVHVCVVSD